MWDPARYLAFETERGRPCRDLVARLSLAEPGRLVDLGCGPGTSTRVLAERWPRARLLGVDRSAEMLAVARASGVAADWIEADLTRWDPPSDVDLLFSNAAFQWIPDHLALVRRLFDGLRGGGVLAFQVPAAPTGGLGEALERVIGEMAVPHAARAIAQSPRVESLETYYDALAGRAASVDLWDSRYVHIFDGPHRILDWSRGTALRPWLDGFPTDADRTRFLEAMDRAIAARYPRRPDGRVLFPFLRRFVVAVRAPSR